MDPRTILLLYVCFFVVEYVFEQLLTLLNMKTVKKNRDVPAVFAGYYDKEQYRLSVAYTLEKSRFSLISATISGLFVLLLVVSGSFGTLDLWLQSFALPLYAHRILYIFLMALIFQAAALPFSLYSQFVIEQRYGFNKMTGKLFILDLIKSLVLSALLFTPLLLGLFWFMDSTGRAWWLYAFLFIAGFQLLLTFLYPVLIAPLFNKFSPLPQGALKERLSALCEKLKFKTKGIFVMDGSRRSAHSNAFFSGFGKYKRIVLFDTLINSLSEEQLAGVLAHEIGHEKKRHVLQHMILSLLMLLLGLFVVNLFLDYKPLFTAFGFSAPSYYAVFVILSFASAPFTFMFTPLFTAWSRKHEYQADAFAVDAMAGADALKGALLALHKKNLGNLTPHPLYSFYHYSHPTLKERLTAMERYAADRVARV